MPFSKVIILFPAKSKSNKDGAKAAKDANDTVPLLPELAGTEIWTLLKSELPFDPVAQIIISKFRAFEASVFLNNTSNTILA